MRKILFGISLLFIFSAGCANQQLHQTLLLHENQRLEEALYVTHAQLADLKRENDELRNSQTGYDETIVPPKRSYNSLPSPDQDLMEAPPFEMPKVILPDQPGTMEVPDSLKGSQSIPVWKPARR
jgi:hypothetical protein